MFNLPPLNPTMAGVLDRMRRAGHPPLHTLGVSAARAAYEAGAQVLEVDRAELARVQELAVPARDGRAMRARLYAPSHGHLPVLLYLHGGGFTIGSIDSHDRLCRELARLAGCAVLSLDYRLAPEHRFPAAHDDAWDALHWLAHAGCAGLGLNPQRLAVGGDSAGGTLAAALAVMARDAGLPLALQLLYYPGVAGREPVASRQHYGSGLVLERSMIDWFYNHYIDEAHRDDWRFAPLHAPDVSGVAPAWIGLAELDPLVDEGVAWGDRLRAAGVAVDLEIYRGVTHEFIKMGRVLREARQAHADAARALAGAFSTET